MSDEWQQGWQDGYNNASVNSRITIHYKMKDGKKVFSSHGGGAKFPETFQHRCGSYNCGYAEWMISGFGAYATKERLIKSCEELGIIYQQPN